MKRLRFYLLKRSVVKGKSLGEIFKYSNLNRISLYVNLLYFLSYPGWKRAATEYTARGRSRNCLLVFLECG